MTAESLKALSHLRSANSFEWYIVPFLAVVIYIYSRMAAREEWDGLFTALCFYAVEFIWEMFNGLVLRMSGYSALWTTPGKSAYLIYVGLTIEISLMFAIAPVALFGFLPKDRNKKIFGINNRLLIPISMGVFCVVVETILNAWGALAWAYSWWSFPHVWLILFVYCFPFWFFTWMYDNVSLARKKIFTLGTIAAAVFCHLLLVVILKLV